MLTRTLILIACFFSILFSNAQDFKKDMIALNNKVFSSKNISYTMHYNLYLDNNFSVPYQERNIKLLKSHPNKLECSDGNNECVFNNDLKILVNHKQKRILITPQLDQISNPGELLDIINSKFDTIMMIYNKIDSKKTEEDLVEYVCELKQGIYTHMKLLYNLKKQIPEKVTFYYKKPIKKNVNDRETHPMALEIIYRDFDFNPKISHETFSQKKYLTKKDNQYALTKEYASYKFINLFENKYESE